MKVGWYLLVLALLLGVGLWWSLDPFSIPEHRGVQAGFNATSSPPEEHTIGGAGSEREIRPRDLGPFALRILQYNIHNAKDVKTKKTNFPGLFKYINEYSLRFPDAGLVEISCFNEVDRFTKRHSKMDQSLLGAKILGMHVLGTCNTLDAYSTIRRDGNSSYGNSLMLSTASQLIPLNVSSTLLRNEDYAGRFGSEDRCLVDSVLEAGSVRKGFPIRVGCTHLDTVRSVAKDQLLDAVSVLSSNMSIPLAILVGDFNLPAAALRSILNESAVVNGMRWDMVNSIEAFDSGSELRPINEKEMEDHLDHVLIGTRIRAEITSVSHVIPKAVSDHGAVISSVKMEATTHT